MEAVDLWRIQTNLGLDLLPLQRAVATVEQPSSFSSSSSFCSDSSLLTHWLPCLLFQSKVFSFNLLPMYLIKHCIYHQPVNAVLSHLGRSCDLLELDCCLLESWTLGSVLSLSCMSSVPAYVDLLDTDAVAIASRYLKCLVSRLVAQRNCCLQGYS
jgi:hypothetical protein